MNKAMTVAGVAAKLPNQSPLTCRLRAKEVVGRRGPIPNMAEVELENCSGSPLKIEYTMTPLQFLELEVIGPGGTVVSEGHFSDRFSPTREPMALRLLAGEKFTADVALLATVPREKRLPGKYTIQASYRFLDFHVMAVPVVVELNSGL